jgi:hypothetical protein
VLRIFIAIKNPSSPAGFAPEKLGPGVKHAKHYITEDGVHRIAGMSIKIHVNVNLQCE